MTPEHESRFRALATGLDGVDTDVYAAHDRDPTLPVLGEGAPDRRICIFGRDPGRDEIRWQEPFIGAGGQQVRKVLYRVVHGEELPDFEASREIGQVAYWANTVPYKPVGNKAWSVKVRRTFQPVVADLLVHGWKGRDVICLGQNAFTWFGLCADKATRDRLKAAWSGEPRFAGGPLELNLTASDGVTADLRLWPMPHPSPLNATWYRHFPDLLTARLQAIGFGPDTWRLDAAERRQ